MTQRTKPWQDRVRNSTEPAIRHLRHRSALTRLWTDLARDLYTPRVCKGMPRFVQTLAQTFWDADPGAVISAITNGDPAYFVTFQVRLDQIDCALVRAGRGIVERAPVMRARFVIDGFQATAATALRHHGGEWPPTAPAAEPAPADEPDASDAPPA